MDISPINFLGLPLPFHPFGRQPAANIRAAAREACTAATVSPAAPAAIRSEAVTSSRA